MKFSTSLVLFTTVTITLAATLPNPLAKRAYPETIYLANCQASTGQRWSDVAFYAADHCSSSSCGAQGNYPDSEAHMTSTSGTQYFNWEGAQHQAYFTDSGATFTFIIDKDAQSKADFTRVGTGWNKWHTYKCMKDNKREIWHASGGNYGAGCSSIYYCLIE